MDAILGLKLENDENELLKEIKDIKRKLNAIEKESKASLEDQLFFGLVFSFAVFLFAFPVVEVTYFLQTSLAFDYDAAMRTAEGVRLAGIVFLLVASLTRYYGAIGSKKTAKRFRFESIEFLMFAVGFALFVFVVNATNPLSAIVGFMSIPIAILILFIVYLLLGILERRILALYGCKQLILKKDMNPVASPLLAILTLSLLIMIIVNVISWQFGLIFPSELNLPTLLLVFFLIAMVSRQRRRRSKRVQK